MDINVEGYTIRKWYAFFEEASSNELGMSADGPPVAKFGVGVVIQTHTPADFQKIYLHWWSLLEAWVKFLDSVC